MIRLLQSQPTLIKVLTESRDESQRQKKEVSNIFIRLYKPRANVFYVQFVQCNPTWSGFESLGDELLDELDDEEDDELDDDEPDEEEDDELDDEDETLLSSSESESELSISPVIAWISLIFRAIVSQSESSNTEDSRLAATAYPMTTEQVRPRKSMLSP